MNIPRNGNCTNNNYQACAACKYQRKKCAPDCILAPYFPHDRQRQFLNAHKLFGVRNITKIIEHLGPHDKDEAMRTIIYQSDMRAHDPVGGCYRYIQELQAQIEYHKAELDLVLHQLAIFQAQAQAQVYNVNGNEVMNSDNLNLYDPLSPHYQYLQQVPQPEQYIMVQENHATTNNNNISLQQEDVNTWAMQDSMSLSSLSFQSKNGSAYVGDQYDQERNLRLEHEELVNDSDGTVLFKVKAEGGCVHQVQDHDLKGAATLFTLTNCTT